MQVVFHNWPCWFKNFKTAATVNSKWTCEVLSTAKDPSNYQDRTVHKNEQKPIDFKIDDNERPAMVKLNKTAQKKRAGKRKLLEKQLSGNAIKMKKIKSNKL